MNLARISFQQTRPWGTRSRQRAGAPSAKYRSVHLPDLPAGLFQPDVILPTQLMTALRSQLTPERRLMAAVLEDAVNCFLKYRFATDRRSRRFFREADEWVMSEDMEWPFSFERICDALGLDPSYLRRGLRRWRARPPTHDQRNGGRLDSRPAVLTSAPEQRIRTGTESVR